MNGYTADEQFEGEDHTTAGIGKGEYERCVFKNCNFSSADLSDVFFVECEFENCDLSMANLTNTAFRTVQFKNCKMLGMRLDQCNKLLLSFSCDSCKLDFSSFFKLKLKSTLFKDCSLKEVEFMETDLTQSKFPGCDFTRANFDNTILNGADFRTAVNYSIDPERNIVKNARFSLTEIHGLLEKYNIRIE